MPTRTRLTILAVTIALASATGALAQPTKAKPTPPKMGVYEAKFDEIANSCLDTGMNIRTGKVTLAAGKHFTVTIPMTSTMYGRVDKHGKFTVKAKLGGTGIAGLNGKFSASGRLKNDQLQMVFIAEYYQGKKPLCTKSWNVNGVHEDALK